MNFPIHLLTLAPAFFLVSCAGVKQETYVAQPGRVIEVSTEHSYREPSTALTANAAVHGGLIGSAIGRCGSGQVIGAAAGVLIGGLLTHAAQQADAHHMHRYTLIKLESGELCEFTDSGKPCVQKGNRVYVVFDEHSLPVSYHSIAGN